MVQHLLLSLVAAPLLLLSNSMPVLAVGAATRTIGPPSAGWSASPADPLDAALAHPSARRLVRCSSAPSGCGTMPLGYEWALENRWAHYFEHISFFVTAVLFWWPVIGSPPLPSPLGYPARMAYTFLAWMPNSLLGAGITLSRGAAVPVLRRRRRRPTASTPLSTSSSRA